MKHDLANNQNWTIDFIHHFSFINMVLTMVSSYGSFDAITDRLNMNTN
jgi:hypothetical protein